VTLIYQDEDPRVTVLLATNKVNDWLRLAIESVIHSDTSTKVVLVLDGLTFADIDPKGFGPRVEVLVKEKSTGLADALNTGLSIITSRYVARLDADDLATHGRFIWQSRFLDDNPDVELIGGIAECIDEHGATLVFPCLKSDFCALISAEDCC
jgi:glycosyltransferase involved in cell wall biosynthesis